MFKNAPPIPHKSFEETPFCYISTPDQLSVMVNALLEPSVTEIAVDLEYHNYRSYRGFLCLMQISTRDTDWVIDLLDPELRQAMIEGALAEVFTNPKVVKV